MLPTTTAAIVCCDEDKLKAVREGAVTHTVDAEEKATPFEGELMNAEVMVVDEEVALRNEKFELAVIRQITGGACRPSFDKRNETSPGTVERRGFLLVSTTAPGTPTIHDGKEIMTSPPDVGDGGVPLAYSTLVT